MSNSYIIIRQELAKNAVSAIQSRYADKLVDIQAVRNGDGAQLKQIHWGAMTPRFSFKYIGGFPQWVHQEITLELMASVDYLDRTLDSRYALLQQVFEDFCAAPDLKDLLSSSLITVVTAPMLDDGEESIDNGKFVTTYRMRVEARQRGDWE